MKRIRYERQRNNHYGIYEYIQVNLAYSSCRMASNRLTLMQVEDVYHTNKMATAFEPTKVDDIIEVVNHFICMCYVVDNVNPEPPLHIFCRCTVDAMRSVKAGMGSYEGENGADWWLWNKGVLPDYYIYINDLYTLGWRKSKSPAKYAPGQMVYGGIYRNEEGLLPDAPGRIWFEADLNYYSGKRNGHRVLWSNDGLMFVTYNHYESFIEVIGG